MITQQKGIAPTRNQTQLKNGGTRVIEMVCTYGKVNVDEVNKTRTQRKL